MVPRWVPDSCRTPQGDIDVACTRTSILQPLITKYSNLNKQYRRDFEGEEYAQKRLQLNSDLEKEIAEKLPYLESREIKKIVIQFSQQQDKMN